MSSDVCSFDWTDDVARYYHTDPKTARSLLKLFLVPDATSVRTPNLPIWADLPAREILDNYRSALDTGLNPFIEDLQRTGAFLCEGGDESPHEHALGRFRNFSLGRLDCFYPIRCQGAHPWRAHRVAVYREELERAGIGELFKHWGDGDPFAHVPVDGTVLIGPYHWLRKPLHRPDLKQPRGEFLLRLADILTQRGAA